MSETGNRGGTRSGSGTEAPTISTTAGSRDVPGTAPEKRAPVQGLTGGIPWSMHVRAYDAYAKRWGAQPALLDLEGRNCRGGFGTEELDLFIPGWREELSELTTLKAKLRAALDALEPFARADRDMPQDEPDERSVAMHTSLSSIGGAYCKRGDLRAASKVLAS
jgi:hypothetical protein